MAIDISVGTIVTVRLEFKMDGDVAYNVLHYKCTSIIDTGTGLPSAVAVPVQLVLPGLGQTMFDGVKAEWAAMSSNEVDFTGVTCQSNYPSPRSRPYHYTPPGPVSGTHVSDALPLQDCITVLKRTIFGERWGVGRVFVCGLPEDGQDKGEITGAMVLDVADLCTKLQATLVAAPAGFTLSFDPVLFDNPDGGPLRINSITSHELSNTTIKTQKRRRPGKGI